MECINYPGGKRYLTQNFYLRERFGGKVIKVSLNGGFTCPNIDGSRGTGGCTYCSAGSGTFGGDPEKSIEEQFNDVRSVLEKKWGKGLYIPYFQANTNTYAPTARLRELYEAALSLPDTVGLAISTRPDCISEEILDYLEELSHRTYLTVELGLQSASDETGRRINRCHTVADFTECCQRLRERNINICAHIINGLPQENHEDMMNTARLCAKSGLHSIKIHLLHIIKGTRLAEEYLRGGFAAMSREDYVSTVCDQLEILPPELIIQRVTGDGDPNTLIAPLWSLKKFVVMNEIDKLMRQRNSYQGKFYEGQ